MHKLIGTAVALAVFAPQIARAQAVETKTAEQVYRNIVELKGTPADQLMPAMQFIAASLGVECSFCHVQGKMDLDDKPAKKMAREMMAMTAAINKNSFRGRQEVTCYSCHHGAEHPAGVPPVQESERPAHAEPRPAPGATAATADQIVEKYVAALGGAEAIGKVTSRVEKGVIRFGGNETPIEVITKAPHQRLSITRMGAGESITAFDGSTGWLGNTGRPAREMSPAESWAAGLDAEFSLALSMKQVFAQLRRGRPETIDGAECETLIASSPGHPPVRLYFDKNSGLLVRMVRYADTPVGRMPTQIDYADYRAADGVKVPHRWTLSRPNGRFTIQIADVKSNVAVDNDRFQKPAGEIK